MKRWTHILLGLCLSMSVQAQNVYTVLQTGHTSDVSYVTFSGDSMVISGDEQGRVVLWDIPTQLQLGAIDAIRGKVLCTDYDRSSNMLVVSTSENMLYVFRDSSEATQLIQTRFPITSLQISEDGQMVVAGADDGSLWFIEEFSEQRMDWGTDVRGVCISTDGKWAYIGLYNGEIHRIDLQSRASQLVYRASATILDMRLSPDDRWLAYSSVGINGNLGELGVYDLRKGRPVYSELRMNKFAGEIRNQTLAFANERTLVFLDHEGKLQALDVKKKRIKELKDEPMSAFGLSSTGAWLAYPEGTQIHLSKMGVVSEPIVLQSHVDQPLRLLNASDGVLLVEYQSGLKRWDLKQMEVDMVKEKFYEHEWDRFDLSEDGTLWTDRAFLRYGVDGEVKTTYRDLAVRRVAGAFSPDNSYYAWLDVNGLFSMLQVDSLVDGQYLTSEQHTRYVSYGAAFAQGGTQRVVYHPSKHEVVLMGPNLQVFDLDSGTYWSVGVDMRQGDFSLPGIYNPHDGLFLAAVHGEIDDTVAYDQNEELVQHFRSTPYRVSDGSQRYINVMNGGVYLFDLQARVLVKSIARHALADPSADVAGLVYNPFDSTILIGYTDGFYFSVSVKDSAYMEKEIGFVQKGVLDIKISDDGKFYFFLMKKGSVFIVNARTLDPICELVAMPDNEFMVLDGDGYYKRSKRPADGVAFMHPGGMAKLSQFDDVYNRPDRIYEAVGLMPQEYIRSVKKVLPKVNTQDAFESAVFRSMVSPKISITNEKEIEFVTSEDEISLELMSEWNGLHDLRSIRVWVNGVPLFEEGKEPRATDPEQWNTKLRIPLSYGENLIKLHVEDEYGLTSTEKRLRIQCNKPYVVPDLYIAMLSVSEYADEGMNLQYAVKDGRDLTGVFVQPDGRKTVGFPSRFGTIHVDTFFNAAATKENITNWKEKLKGSKPEDYVILYVSGHGLLDTALNFWFATHDVDFDAPQERGMSFSDLEELLMGIPARQKLFLMDACHSGEVVEGTVEVDSGFTMPDGAKGQLIGFQTKGLRVHSVKGTSLDKSELKQTLFSNYQSRSGATVIAAASGNSFALESPEWSNGIFTYTVIGGMIYRWADLNDDGEVSVVELSKYVSKEVKEKTRGMQIPNDRQENMENNFRIW